MEIKKLAQSWGFEALSEQMSRDRIVLGVRDLTLHHSKGAVNVETVKIKGKTAVKETTSFKCTRCQK